MSDNPAENVSDDPGTITTFNTSSNSLVSNAAYSQFRTPKDEILLDSEPELIELSSDDEDQCMFEQKVNLSAVLAEIERDQQIADAKARSANAAQESLLDKDINGSEIRNDDVEPGEIILLSQSPANTTSSSTDNGHNDTTHYRRDNNNQNRQRSTSRRYRNRNFRNNNAEGFGAQNGFGGGNRSGFINRGEDFGNQNRFGRNRDREGFSGPGFGFGGSNQQANSTNFNNSNSRPQSRLGRGRAEEEQAFGRRGRSVTRHHSPLIRGRSHCRPARNDADRRSYCDRNRNRSIDARITPSVQANHPPMTMTATNRQLPHPPPLSHFQPYPFMFSPHDEYSEPVALRSIQVSGLSPATTEEKLANHLGTYGRVLHCKLFPGQFCAFATFSNEQEARCAVANLDGKQGVIQIIHASMAKSDFDSPPLLRPLSLVPSPPQMPLPMPMFPSPSSAAGMMPGMMPNFGYPGNSIPMIYPFPFAGVPPLHHHKGKRKRRGTRERNSSTSTSSTSSSSSSTSSTTKSSSATSSEKHSKKSKKSKRSKKRRRRDHHKKKLSAPTEPKQQ